VFLLKQNINNKIILKSNKKMLSETQDKIHGNKKIQRKQAGETLTNK